MPSQQEPEYQTDGEQIPDVSTRKSLLSVLPRNLNIYWIVVTALAVWFLFVFTPQYLVQTQKWKDFLLWMHLVGVVGIYLACVHNTLITPSWHKQMHVWVGRIGLLLGFFGFPFGVYLAWGRPTTDSSFSIPITIGGVLQIISQVMGYLEIRKFQLIEKQIASLSDIPNGVQTVEVDALKKKSKTFLMLHIRWMLGLFVQACSIPAIIRVTRFGGLWSMLVGIGVLIAITTLYTRHMILGVAKKYESIEERKASSIVDVNS